MTEVVERAIYELTVRGESLAPVIQLVDRLAVAEEKVDRATRTTTDGVARFIARLDQRARAEQDLIRRLEQINRFEQEGIGTSTQRARAVELTTQKFVQQAQAIDGLNARIQQLAAKFDPATASAQRMASELAELSEAQRQGVTIIGGYVNAFDRIVQKYDEGAQAARRLAAAQAELIATARAEQNVRNSQQAFGTALATPVSSGRSQGSFVNLNPAIGSAAMSAAVFEEAAKEQERLALATQKYKDKLDPLLPLERAYRAELVAINQVASAGGLSQRERLAAIEHVTKAHEVEKAALKANTAEMGYASIGARQAQFAMTNLSFQVNDVASGLISGQEPFRIFAQQSGQIFQIYQQSPNVFRDTATFIRGLITPMNLARGGAVALAAGIVLLIGKAIELENKFRTFNVVLKGFGNEGLTTAGNLEGVERELRRVGLAADEASEAIQKVIRTPGVNPAAAGLLARTGAGLGVLTGEGTAAATGRLAQLVADTDVEGLIKLGVQLTAIQGPQARAIRDTKEWEGSVKATDQALGLIANHLRDTYANSLTTFARAMRDLSTAFSEFLRDAAVSEFIQEGLARIKTTLEEVRSILNLFKDLEGRFTRTGDQATQKALDARKDLDQALAERDRAAGGTPPGTGAERFSMSGLSANTEALQRLNAVLTEASKSLPEGFRVEATSATRPGSSGQHGGGNAVDVRIVGMSGPLPNQGPVGSNAGLYQDLAIAAFNANQRMFPGTPLTWGGRFETRAGSGMADWMHFDTGPDRGRFGPPLAELAAARATTTAATMPDGSATSAVALRDQANLLDKQTREYEKLNDATAKYGLEQVRAEARLRGLIEAEAQEIKGKDALTFADNAATQAVRQRIIELDKEAANQEQATQGTIRAITTATSAADAYRLIAQSQAELRVKTAQATDVAGEQRRILEEGAASAILAGRQQVLAATPQIEAAERVAEAAKQGAVAQREAQRQQEAGARTQDALAKAEASRNPILIEQARALNDAALAEIRRSDAAKVSLANTERIRAEQENQQVLRLQVQLQGQSAEQINNQVALLRTKIELDKQGESSTQAQKDAVLATVAATGAWTQKLSEAQREQQRLEDGVRSIASTINSELTRSIENAFSGQKVEDWGTRIKRMLGSLAAQISDSLFIKPLLGSIAGVLGFGNVAQGLGSFGGLGSLFGGSSSTSPVATLTPNGQGGFSIQTLGQGVGVLKDVASFGSSSSSSGGLFGNLFGSGGTSFFNNIGSSLGFATPGAPFSATVQGPSFLGATGAAAPQGSLFGSLTLGNAFSSIGAGFGAGSLLNSLLGGDPLMGSIGSGVGSIAGTLLPSLLGFSLGPLGGILGGALGSLFGLFGNQKPRNASAGGDIDFATGQITASFMGGNREIDQATQSALKEISAFTQNLLRISGGTLTGQALIQHGVNTGFTADSTLPGYEGRFSLGKDPAAAVQTIQLALSRSLTGISESMKTVINSVTDPAQLEAAIQFAGVYDDLKEAYDSAFSSISQDTKVIGPFGQALDQLNTTFEDLTQKAGQYGLDLKPVTAGLEEATRRLRTDFQTFLSQQEAQLIGGTDYLGTALQAHQQQVQNWSDAVRLGFDDVATATRVNQIELAQLGAAFSNLSLGQLIKAVETFAEVAPEVSQFAQSLIDAGQYLRNPIDQLILAITDPITAAIEKERIAGAERVRIAQATGEDIIKVNQYNRLLLDQIWQQATASLRALSDSLTTGSLSGLTISAQIEAANDNFEQQLAVVQAGNLAGIAALTTAAQALIDLSIQAYGNAPQTATIRTDVLSAITPLLATTPGFASGTMATPPGTILVGERGPELITQSGGLRVWSNPETERMLSGMPGWHFADGTFAPPPIVQTQAGASDEEIKQLLARLISLLEANNEITREGGVLNDRGLERVVGAIEEANAPVFEQPARRRA